MATLNLHFTLLLGITLSCLLTSAVCGPCQIRRWTGCKPGATVEKGGDKLLTLYDKLKGILIKEGKQAQRSLEPLVEDYIKDIDEVDEDLVELQRNSAAGARRLASDQENLVTLADQGQSVNKNRGTGDETVSDYQDDYDSTNQAASTLMHAPLKKLEKVRDDLKELYNLLYKETS